MKNTETAQSPTPTFPEAKTNADGIKELQPQELFNKLRNGDSPKPEVIDVRRPDEYTGELGHIKGSQLVTLELNFKSFITTAPKDKAYVFVCKSGGRSGQAAAYAQSLGIRDVYNMVGGMIHWNQQDLEIEK